MFLKSVSRVYYIWYFTCYFPYSLSSILQEIDRDAKSYQFSAFPTSQLSLASFTHHGQTLMTPTKPIFHVGEAYSISYQNFKRIIILITSEIQFTVPSFLTYTMQSTPILIESRPAQGTPPMFEARKPCFRGC